MSKVIVVLVGNIGSGKTTLTKVAVDMGWIAIARDGLRYAIGSGKYIFNPDYEPIIHEANVTFFRRFTDLGVNIVMDETNITRGNRKAYIHHGHEQGYKVVAVEFHRWPKDVAIARRLSNNHGENDRAIWTMVWERNNQHYQAPTKEEGFDEVIQLKGDNSEAELTRLLQGLTNGSNA
jgi:predicted kinase